MHAAQWRRSVVLLNEKQKNEIELVFNGYQEKVAELFHQTGDSLSIPKKISLHTDLHSETVFLDLIEKAAKRATKIKPHITPISHEIIFQTYTAEQREQIEKDGADTALLLSAQFFHKRDHCQSFEHL